VQVPHLPRVQVAYLVVQHRVQVACSVAQRQTMQPRVEAFSAVRHQHLVAAAAAAFSAVELVLLLVEVMPLVNQPQQVDPSSEVQHQPLAAVEFSVPQRQTPHLEQLAVGGYLAPLNHNNNNPTRSPPLRCQRGAAPLWVADQACCECRPAQELAPPLDCAVAAAHRVASRARSRGTCSG